METTIMENQMEKKMENEMETGIIIFACPPAMNNWVAVKQLTSSYYNRQTPPLTIYLY